MNHYVSQIPIVILVCDQLAEGVLSGESHPIACLVKDVVGEREHWAMQRNEIVSLVEAPV